MSNLLDIQINLLNNNQMATRSFLGSLFASLQSVSTKVEDISAVRIPALEVLETAAAATNLLQDASLVIHDLSLATLEARAAVVDLSMGYGYEIEVELDTDAIARSIHDEIDGVVETDPVSVNDEINSILNDMDMDYKS
jgi:hypothetical protein